MEIMVDKMSPLSVLVALVVGGVLLLWLHHWSSCWRGATKSGARLPNGSFGWPIIGETLELVRNPFLYGTSHVKRYGSIFKTSLFLNPTICGTTPEFYKFMISNPKLFIHGQPQGIVETLPKSFLTQDGPSHIHVKKFFSKGFLPESLRSVVHVLEDIVLQHLASWEQEGTVGAKEALAEMTFDAASYIIFRVRDMRNSANGRNIIEDFKAVNKCLSSAPIKLPGTAYDKGLKAKARLSKLFKSLAEEKKQKTNIQSDSTDPFGQLLAADNDEDIPKEVKDLDDDGIADNMIIILFGAYETTKTTLLWIVKMMEDYPDFFRQLQAEQEGLLKDKGPSLELGPRLTWDDTRRMVAGKNFFQEIQRYISFAAVIPREVVEDVEYEGYFLPKGWKVLSIPSIIHNNPELHPDPSRFNPDRFSGATQKPSSYVPFGGGPRMCPGGEFAKLLSLIVIHHLTTTFAHKSVGPDRGVEYQSSVMMPVGGYPVNVRRRI